MNAASMATGQLSKEAGQLSMTKFSHLKPKMPITATSLPMEKSYINSITNGTPTSIHIALKEVIYVEGIPRIQWTEAEVDTMNKIENLQEQEIVVLEKEIRGKEEEKKDDALENTGKPERPWVHYFRKGKTRVLSSGLVVGDPVITANAHKRKETGEVIQQKETTKDWVNQVFGKTSTDQANGSDVKEIPANEKDIGNKKQITMDKIAEEETNAKENESDSYQVNNKEIAVLQSHQVVQHTEEVANDKAIIMVPNQTDVIQVISPIRVLHDIVSHNLEEGKLLVLEDNQAKGVSEVEHSNEEMNYLPQEADLSPKLLKSSRKRKQQASGVENQCIRVQPKRNKSKIKL
ncbi:hypothetical protein KY285_023448 [Solanum tuberosum]|nr:hypothetical protein KY289_023782 [Solanum tuberosum]KAH0675647.1 hypothetical protein KY285_023448 [Solanum tuberosum]